MPWPGRQKIPLDLRSVLCELERMLGLERDGMQYRLEVSPMAADGGTERRWR